MNNKRQTDKKATIADVARLAGVSIKTVSRVANKEVNVSPETRDIVQQAIDQLGYRPNPSARALASRRSYLIGLLYDNPSPSYLVNVQNGALKTCREEGYDLVIHPCEYRSDNLIDDVSAMITKSRVDGIILTPPLSDLKHLLSAIDKLDTPYVRISPADATLTDRSVVTNDLNVCAKMTEHLVSLGHIRIGFIAGHPDHKAVAKRYEGYLAGLAAAGLTASEELVQQGYNSVESGEKCALSLLSLAQPPSAIFAANDDMAAGALRAAHKLGVKVPQQLSVVGFDDTPIANQVWPPLTTIRQPIKEMAERAARLLIFGLSKRDDDELQQQIDCSIVLRESTGAV